MIKRFFILLLAIVASVGMSYAQAGIASSGTKGGMSYTFYDNGLLEISGSGALPGQAFTNWDGGFGASVKNIRFAEDCEVYGLDYMWFACYTETSQLETIEINSVAPIMFSGSSGGGITYQQDGAVTITITAPGIVDVNSQIIDNYGSPVNMIFNMPATTVFERKWFSGLENNFAVTIPTGAKGHIPAGYSFKDPYDQKDYDDMVEHGHEDLFWESHSHLVEGVNYTNGVESTFEITAENASQIFGQATVSFQAPTQASNSEWVLWRKSDLKTFSDMSSGDQKVYKDVTVKVNNGVYNTDSGFGIHFDSSDEDGVQFVAPEGKVFKRIVILNEYGTFSDPNWSYDGNYKKWSGSANTVGFEGDICGISLIEFEVEGSAPANQLYMEVDGTAGTLKWGLAGSNPVYDGNAIQYSDRKYITTLTIDASCQNHTLTSFYNLFYVFSGLTTINGLENLATANVESMRYMFYDCKALTSLDLSSFNTAKVTDMKGMFNGCSNLTTIYVGDGWNTSAVTNGSAMFYGCTNLPNYDSEATGVDKAYVGTGGYLSANLTPADVMALIQAIGTVELTAECKAKIDAARAAYNALSAADKDLVTNYSTLQQAETDYAALNQAEANKVIAKINNIPQPVELTLATRDSIQNARAAYDALTADQQALVPAAEYQKLLDAEAALAEKNPGGGAPAGALNGKFTINADGDQIAFAKGNLQATTTDLGANWTWGFAANQWNYLGIAVANSKINGNGTVSENGTVDLFGWSTAATYYGINNSDKFVDYPGDFVDWGPNMGAGWRTLTKDEWNYLIENNTKGRATVNDKNGYIFLPNDWSGPAFTPDPNNFTTNVYSGDDWTAMENAGAVFLPCGPARNRNSALVAMDVKYYSSTSLNNDSSYVFTIYYNQSQSACTVTSRAYGCMVRLVTEGSVTPLDSAQVVKDLIEAIPVPVSLEDACVNAVQAARDAYNALADATKGALDAATVQKLNQAITDYTALIQAGADAVKDKIAALPNPVQESDLKLSVYEKVQEARAAYDALTTDQKALVTNYQTLLDAEAAFAALPPVGSETVITWDKNTGIEKMSGTATSPAYEGITISIKGGGFGPQDEMLRFNIAGLGLSFEFANTLGGNFQKIVISSTNAMPSTPLAGMGEGWAASSGNKIATWTGDAANVKIWDGLTATSYWDVNTIQFTLGSSVSPIVAAQAAVDLINAIPDPVTLDEACVKAIKDAREAVTALGGASSLIDAADITKLTKAEQALKDLNQAEADKVIAKINNIPTPVKLKLATRDSIESARAAYDALTAEQKALVPDAEYQKLLDAEDALADLVPTPTPVPVTPTVWDMNSLKVGDIIYEGDQLTNMSSPRYINNVETIHEDKCPYTLMKSAGETSYVLKDKDGSYLFTDGSLAITPTSVGLLVTNVNSGDINVVVYSLANVLDSAQAVKDLIGAIREPLDPTEACGAEIAAALNAYDALSDAAKGALDDADVQKLNDAATQYAALEVSDAIGMIPDKITYDPMTKSYIEIAKAKYDALSDASKALVDDEVVAKLTNAEQAWADLVAKVEHNVSYIGKDGELKHETVALLHIPDPAPDFNGYEFVRWDVKAGDFLEEGLRVKAVYTPIITTNPMAYDTLEYNGLAQELVKAGVAKEGHIEYSLYPEEPESWSANLPTATNAAAYVVYYKLVREGHEDYMAGNITVVIAKTQVSYTAPVAYDTLVYNYNMQTLIEAGITNDGIFEYTLNPLLPDSWSTDLPQGMNAGTYNVNFRVIGDMNHFDSIVESPIVVTIAKRDIVVTAPAAYDTLVYNAQAQTLAIDGTADFNTMEYTLTPNDDNSWFTTMPKALNAGSYDIYYRVPGDANHNDFEPQNITATIAQAPLTITAIDSTIVYGDAVPEFIATYSGWQGQDDETVVSNLAFSCAYQQGSYIGTYAINPNSATAHNYAITFVDGTLTVNKAHVYVSGAEAQIAKFADGHANAVVLEQGILNGIKLNDPIAHVTTAAFSSADVAENLTITLFYELTGDAALLNNYNLDPTSDIFTNEGVIIEPFIPDDQPEEKEDEEAEVEEGIEIYAYGYCDGSGYSLKYHLESGNPDQYKIDFADSRFTDVDWTNLVITGKDGTIDIDIPVDMPTGDYTMTVYFRDSRFDWLESRQFNVTFHVNLPETYVRPLFDNVIALVDTCHCLTDIQWYWRANSTELWQPIEGANGYYYHVDGKLTGEYFVSAKMNGEPTYTCGQTDMETLYSDTKLQQAQVKAYPNPVVTTTTVTIENSTEWNHNIRIVNLMGAEVMSDTFEGNETSVEMGNYPQGHYMISVDGIVVKVMKK